MWLQLVIYACLVIFATSITWRAVRYARMPVHLRWELYPVAHEKGRPYGGSYLEEVGWWHRPRQTDPFGEFNTFMGEILFFKEYFKNKRGFWYFVYPFHIGLFLLPTWAVLLAVGAILSICGIPVTFPPANMGVGIVCYLTLIAGIISFALGVFGTVGLLIKRSLDEDLKKYTDPIDYFNLICIFIIFATGLASWMVEDPTFAVARDYMTGLFTFKAASAGSIFIAFLLSLSLFLAYMPFTRMLHYVAKYFTYHKVRWDDTPNANGSRISKEVSVLLNQRESWSAPHIQQGKTWSDQAAGTGIEDGTSGKK
jgi:nitrate reductase gamma subunit